MKNTVVHSNYDLVIFVAPALLLILCMSEIPFIMNIFYAFTNWNGLAKVSTFVGWENFINIFGDANFQNSLLFTFKFTFFYVILTNIFALIVAIALEKPLRSNKLFRTIFFVPNAISVVVIGFMWRFIFMYGFQAAGDLTHWEIFNWSWLGDYKLAWVSVVIVSVWQSIGYMMMIYIAN